MAARTGLSDDVRWMTRALELAALGQGHVEPNPMVGCVIIDGQQVLAEGHHRQFGGPHAEIEALSKIVSDGSSLANATLYVNLEPCCHHGKTAPCTQAILAAGIRHVVVAMEDPFPAVAGQGIAQLRAAGVTCETGCLAEQAAKLNAPYLQRTRSGIPWFHAKWAMSLDGRLATDDGESRWISNDESRRRVHELRGRMDAIVVGRGTLQRDDPLLTARPPGPRAATRVVLASAGFDIRRGQILESPREPATIVVVDPQHCADERRGDMAAWGCDVLPIPNLHSVAGLQELARLLGQRKMTNVMVEGGPRVLGSFYRAGLFREYHVFIAPILIGGARIMSPLVTTLETTVPAAFDRSALETISIESFGNDLYWHLRKRKVG